MPPGFDICQHAIYTGADLVSHIRPLEGVKTQPAYGSVSMLSPSAASTAIGALNPHRLGLQLNVREAAMAAACRLLLEPKKGKKGEGRAPTSLVLK